MPLSLPQKTIAQCPKRFRVAICGRRFGKTILAIRELCKFAQAKKESEVWYVAPSYRMAKGLTWRKLKRKLQALHWIHKVNESELTIELKNGSRICLKGADNPDSLRGVGLDFVVLDEFADISPVAWNEVLRPTLADRNGSGFFISTPKGMGNWSHDLFYNEDDPKKADEWQSFHYNSIQGGYITEDEIESMRNTMGEKQFDQECNASFVDSGNRVWYGFDAKENVKPFIHDVRKPIKALYVGIDFNVDPLSVAIFVRYDKFVQLDNGTRKKLEIVHAIDEIELFGSNTNEIIDEIKARYPGVKVWTYPDPAGKQRHTSAAGKTDHKLLRNAGFEVKAKRVTRSIRDGVNAVNAKLCNAIGDRTLLVDPKCKKITECFIRHNYKPKSTIPEKDTGYDHMADAIRYFIDYEFPIRLAYDEDEYVQESYDLRAGL
jgi:hypothetical protein